MAWREIYFCYGSSDDGAISNKVVRTVMEIKEIIWVFCVGWEGWTKRKFSKNFKMKREIQLYLTKKSLVCGIAKDIF